MRAIDVCCGAGGLSEGLRRAGFDVFGVDNDEAAVDVHRRHVGPCDLADIATWHPPHEADLVAGGVPCVAYSPAGKHLGLADPRGTLFVHLIRIAVEAKARAIMLENSDGLAYWEGGRALRIICDTMRAAGFPFVCHTILNAADMGVPQRRKRLFIVGFRDRVTFSFPSPTHGPWIGATKPWVTVREALGLGKRHFEHGPVPWTTRTSADGHQGQRMLDVDEPGPVVRAARGAEFLSPLDEPSPTICAGGGTTGGPEPIANRKLRDRLHRALGEESVLDRPSPDPKRKSRRPQAELAKELHVAGVLDRPSTTVQCDQRLAVAGHHERQQRGAVRLTIEQRAVRLTIEQRAALQAFPPDWTWPPGETDASRCVGNAVPPPLAEALGREIWKALE